MRELFDSIKHNRLINNVSWIFFGNVAHAILRFVLDAVVARLLSLNDNGMLNYASSLISFVLVLCGFGFSSVITREFVEDEENAGRLLTSCILTQSAAGAAAIAVIQFLIRIVAPNEPELYPIVFLQSFSSILGSLGLLVYWFRYKDQAKKVAIQRLAAFFIGGVIRVAVLCLTDNLLIYVCSTLVESMLFSLFLGVTFFKSYHGSLKFSFPAVKKILKSSYPFIFSALLSMIYAHTDRIMLKSMLDNEAVALLCICTSGSGNFHDSVNTDRGLPSGGHGNEV